MKLPLLLLTFLITLFSALAQAQHRTDHGYSPQHYAPQTYRDHGYYGTRSSLGHRARGADRHDAPGSSSGYGYAAAYGHGYRGASVGLHVDTFRSRGHRSRRDTYQHRFDH